MLPKASACPDRRYCFYQRLGPLQQVSRLAAFPSLSKQTSSLSPGLCHHFSEMTWIVVLPLQDFDVDCYAQRRLSGGSHSYGGESPRLSPCSSIGKLSKSDEQLSSLDRDRDSGQCSRNTSCETLGGLRASLSLWFRHFWWLLRGRTVMPITGYMTLAESFRIWASVSSSAR